MSNVSAVNSPQHPNIPRHIAIIMDGNGRWAEQRGLSRSAGHAAGVEALRRTVEHAAKCGVEQLTVYAFSDENWHRPSQEVDALMGLIVSGLAEHIDTFAQAGIRLATIGDTTRLPNTAQQALQEAMHRTEHGRGLLLVVALSYSSHGELERAAQRMLQAAANLPQPAGGWHLAHFLETAAWPDPDLLIRTGGELRLSNFLLYQLAYTELYFTDVLWPDFGPGALDAAIASFSGRERRYGRVPSASSDTSVDK